LFVWLLFDWIIIGIFKFNEKGFLLIN